MKKLLNNIGAFTFFILSMGGSLFALAVNGYIGLVGFSSTNPLMQVGCVMYFSIILSTITVLLLGTLQIGPFSMQVKKRGEIDE